MSDADSQTLPDDDAGSFSVVHSGDEGGARVGVLQTPHGTFETPCFLPVASHGELRNLTFEDAADCGSRLLMVNAWHVFRRAGAEELLKAGGLHGWMGWSHSVMTDSGGYQVYSLRETSRVDDEGVTFLSPEDGKEDQLTPERVIEIQRIIGSDVITVLDECPPYPCSKEAEQAAMERTHLWARRSVSAFQEMPPRYGRRQALWGSVQGGVSEDLRKISVDELSQHPFDGFGIGGLSIGMPPSVMREMTALVCERLPYDKPRHLLGTGLPPAILDGIEDGVDYHWWDLAKAAGLSTLLSVGAELTMDDDDRLIQAIRNGAQDTINDAGQQIVQRQLQVAPTLTIRPGFPVRVIVTRDLILEPYGG